MHTSGLVGYKAQRARQPLNALRSLPDYPIFEDEKFKASGEKSEEQEITLKDRVTNIIATNFICEQLKSKFTKIHITGQTGDTETARNTGTKICLLTLLRPFKAHNCYLKRSTPIRNKPDMSINFYSFKV